MLNCYHIRQYCIHERKYKNYFQFELETTKTDIFKLSLKIMVTSFSTKDSKLVFKLTFPNKLTNLYLIPTDLPWRGSDVMFFH